MIKAVVKNPSGKITNEGIFNDDAEAEAWAATHGFTVEKINVTTEVDKVSKTEKALAYLE